MVMVSTSNYHYFINIYVPQCQLSQESLLGFFGGSPVSFIETDAVQLCALRQFLGTSNGFFRSEIRIFAEEAGVGPTGTTWLGVFLPELTGVVLGHNQSAIFVVFLFIQSA